MQYLLKDILTPYSKKNAENKYEPVAVGKYGIRKRSNIYKKELADDYSKNKLIYKDTLTIGLGSKQIDFGVLIDDATYSVSPAYSTFEINTNIVLSKWFQYCLDAHNAIYTKKYMIASARQGKKVDVTNLLLEQIEVPPFDIQQQIVDIIEKVQNIIIGTTNRIALYDELVKSRFIELFDGKGYPTLKWNDVYTTTTGKLDSNAMVENGEYPFFTCAKEVFRIDKYAFDQEALLLAGNNAAGKYDVKYYKGKFNAYQRTYVLGLKEDWSYQLFRYQLEDKLVYLQQQSLGGLTKYLTLKILGELEFIVPPMDKQNEFTAFVEQTDKSKLAATETLKYLEELKASLMNKYFG